MSELASSEPPETPESSRAIFTDVARVFGVVVLLIIIAAVLAQFVPLIAMLLYAIVALLFFMVPERLLEKRGEDPADYAITRGNVPRGLAWGFGATLLTLPLFIPGYFIWEHYFLDREFQPNAARYMQWSTDVQGEPTGWGKDGAGVWVWSDRDVLRVGLRNDGGPNNRVTISADQPFKPDKRGTVVLKPLETNADGESPRWELTLTHAQGRGVVTIRGPTSMRVSVAPIVDENPRWPMYQGPRAEPVEDGAFEDDRGLWWLALWFATQFLLVALPEEVFYRGFIQTRLEQAFEARGSTASWLGFTPAIFWTSVLFGIGHLVVPVGGAIVANRMAVFFPSLLFGWLRRRTDSVLAPTIYHAFSNAMVLLAAVHFT